MPCPAFYLFLALLPIVASFVCGRRECDQCIDASREIAHWDEYVRNAFRWRNLVSRMIATSPAATTLETTQPSGRSAHSPIEPRCRSIPMSCQRSFRFLTSSRTKYDRWLSMGGSHASSRCKERVGRFLCMETFPSCAAANHYAVFPCRETCQSLDAVCHKNTPEECPLDGPSTDATTPGNGTHFNSNNELQSCFFLNRTIHEYPSVYSAGPFTHCEVSSLLLFLLQRILFPSRMHTRRCLSFSSLPVCLQLRWFRNRLRIMWQRPRLHQSDGPSPLP